MKLFINKKQKKRVIISFPFLVVFLLAFMPFGTFDPRKPEFWVIVIMAFVMAYSTLLTMKKNHLPGSDKIEQEK